MGGAPVLRRRLWNPKQSRWFKGKSTVFIVFGVVFGVCLSTYGYLLARLFVRSSVPHTATTTTTTTALQHQRFLSVGFKEWKEIAVNLARLPPDEALRRLEEEDPFQVRTVNSTNLAATRSGFDCRRPRISLPDRRNHTASQRFREGHGMIYFQHLRKAGGTHFCKMAEANFHNPRHIPRYFCMPDYDWAQKSKQKCAGCLHKYTAQQIMANMGEQRILGNEWDSFDTVEHWKLVDAVYVTSFRSPMDRAVSQFRFECEEGRGCHFNNVTAWWSKRRDLYNVYTRTFSDVQRQGRIWTGPKFAEERASAVGKALDTLARFHLVLHMEFLAHAVPMVQSTLGFTDVSTLVQQRVRPHNQQLQRTDSYTARTYLTPAQYAWMHPMLALDEILTDAARRMFLERLVCDAP